VRAVPRLCEFYPGICLTTEEKKRKNLIQVEINLSHLLSQAKTIAMLDNEFHSVIFVNKDFNYEAGILNVISGFSHDVGEICDLLEYEGPHTP
jgi:hypothetical protein